MKKPRKKKRSEAAVTVVKLPPDGKLQIVADKGVTPIVTEIKENVIQVVPVKKSWLRQFLGY